MIGLKGLRIIAKSATLGEPHEREVRINPCQLEELLNRLEAAEKVCEMLESHYGGYLNHEYCNAIKKWQEVKRCADQQQKKS